MNADNDPVEHPQPPRPEFRPAEVVTKEDCEAALRSGDPDQVEAALIDGSRCLDQAWVVEAAMRFMAHEDPKLRWAAVFALDFVRDEIASRFQEDFEVVFKLGRLALDDPDPYVRSMAVTTLVDLVGLLSNWAAGRKLEP